MSGLPDGRVAVTSPTDDQQSAPLYRLFSRISEISTLPTVAQRVIEVANNEQSSIDDLREVIQGDPALVARIMRSINSSFYGMRQTVTDLRMALSLLGFHEIRNLALTVFVARMFRTPGTHGRYTREGLWRHLQGVALVSRTIARVTDLPEPEEAYVAGLLHDIGLILVDQHMRRHFCELIDRVKENKPTCNVERQLFTFDHTELGAFVADQWNFPDKITDVIRFHHQSDQYRGPHRDLVNAVTVANYLCSRAGWQSLGVHNVPPPSDAAYAGLGLDKISLAVIWEEVHLSLEAMELLNAS